MKKVVMLLAMMLMAGSVFAQSKGETDVTLGGALFTNTDGGVGSDITPSFGVGYYFMDKIRLDAGLSYGKEGKNLPIMVGGRYSYWTKDKMRVNGGVNLTYGLGSGDEIGGDKPMDLKITAASLEYWPMEGGALVADLFYSMNAFNTDFDSKTFGIGLGMLVRWK